MENNNFWKENYKVLGEHNPIELLKLICKQLSQKTSDKVYAEISEIETHIKDMYDLTSLADKMTIFTKPANKKPKDQLGEKNDDSIKTYLISIKCKDFKEYAYKLFFIEFNFTMYPVKIAMDEDISRELNLEDVIEIENENDYIEIIRQILSSDKVTNIIQSLLTAIEMKEK